MVRREGEGIAFRVGDEIWPKLPWHPDRPERTVEAWCERERLDWKVRSRALTNTLYARLFLSDAFLHGLGGGKYDAVTDTIGNHFYGVEPPRYLVLSATLRLPFVENPTPPAQLLHLARRLRDLHYNPQRHLPPDAIPAPTGEKQEWILRQPTAPDAKRQRFQVLRDLSAQLRPRVADQIEDTRRQFEECRCRIEDEAGLRRRDFAFCLFPEERLRPFCTQFM
jgi:hypothetical protein